MFDALMQSTGFLSGQVAVGVEPGECMLCMLCMLLIKLQFLPECSGGFTLRQTGLLVDSPILAYSSVAGECKANIQNRARAV